MKRIILSLTAALAALTVGAKDIKTLVVTTQPQMHCENCENKIKGNLRFEKGVKDIATDISAQKVTITYDADKTTPARLIKSFDRFGYKATELPTPSQPAKASSQPAKAKKKK